MRWPTKPPARHGSAGASRCISVRRKQSPEVPLQRDPCIREFAVTSEAFARNNSTLRRCRRLHRRRCFGVKRVARRRRVMACPNVSRRFLRASTKNAPLATRPCQCFEGCCRANAFRCVEQKQQCKKFHASLSDYICDDLGRLASLIYAHATLVDGRWMEGCLA